MDAKERLIRFKDLLRILGREHSLESSDYRTAVLQESWTLLELLGTIEGFISDERLGIAGEDQRKLDAAKSVLRSWMNTAKGTLTPQQAQQFSRNVTMIIARTTQSLDQMLTAVDAERKDTGRATAYASKSSVPWYQNVMRVAVLSIAPLIAGCTPGQKVFGAEPGGPGITQTQEQTEEEKLYAQARELEKTDKKAAQDVYLKAIDIDMKKGSVEKILEKELANGSITLIKAPGTTYDKQEEPEWVTQYKAELNKAAKDPNCRGVLVMFYDGTLHTEETGAGQKAFDAGLREGIIFKQLRASYSKEITMIAAQVRAPIRVQDAHISWYNRTGNSEWSLPPIRGPPSIAMYIVEAGRIQLIDIQFEGPIENKSVPPKIRNNRNYWIDTLIFGKPNDEKKLYKYGNRYELSEVASR